MPYFPVHELKDQVGMAGAVTMISASLRDGINCKNLGFASTRRTRIWIGNMFNSAGGYDERPQEERARADPAFISGSPTDQRWFHRFVQGTKLRMGEVRFQNKALTLEQVLGLGDMLDVTWNCSTKDAHRERLEELMCFILIRFGVGLRGEEVPLVSVRGL